MTTKEIYISTDIETDGPIPGVNSMLSFASAAYDEAGRQRGVFEANLETLPGAEADPRTMAWWHGQPRAWGAARANQQPPAQAMETYVAWIAALPGKPVFVAYPLLFDMMFVHWYLIRFTGSSPFSHSGIDIKTMAYVAMGTKSYRGATKRNMPARWKSRREKHSHVALDDAREQGALFLKIRKELMRKFGSAF